MDYNNYIINSNSFIQINVDEERKLVYFTGTFDTPLETHLLVFNWSILLDYITIYITIYDHGDIAWMRSC